LPPVFDRTERVPDYKFAFQSPAWREAGVKVIELSEVFRQVDEEFIGHLMRIRRGEISDDTVVYFNRRVGQKLDLPTRLHAKVATVSRINEQHLRKLPGASVTFRADFDGQEYYRPKLFGTSYRPGQVDEIIELKVGAPVVFTRNVYTSPNTDGPRTLCTFIFANGERGVVEDMEGNIVTVRKSNGTRVTADPISYEYKNGNGKPVATAVQIPLRLAWAMTIHKAQGATLDKVECDVSSCFDDGHAYVALSRARTYEGLSLTAQIAPSAITADPDVLRFYDAMAEDKDPYGDTFDPTNPTPTRCEACGRLLGRPGGFDSTGMCGLCATGDSELEYLFGDMW
jgi:ATP-dependent DNA helicase PIF1